MQRIFGELKKLPCTYCKNCNCYADHCSKRKHQFEDLDTCPYMELDMEMVTSGIKNYFELIKN